MDSIDPIGFAREWEAAWNRRDVEAVLQHFHDDAVFTSPLAQKIGVAADGVLKGKSAIRSYWKAALAKSEGSEPHFQVSRVYQGVNMLVIAFVITSGDQKVDRVEVLRFKDGLVIEGHGTFVTE